MVERSGFVVMGDCELSSSVKRASRSGVKGEAKLYEQDPFTTKGYQAYSYKADMKMTLVLLSLPPESSLYENHGSSN